MTPLFFFKQRIALWVQSQLKQTKNNFLKSWNHIVESLSKCFSNFKTLTLRCLKCKYNVYIISVISAWTKYQSYRERILLAQTVSSTKLSIRVIHNFLSLPVSQMVAKWLDKNVMLVCLHSQREFSKNYFNSHYILHTKLKIMSNFLKSISAELPAT